MLLALLLIPVKFILFFVFGFFTVSIFKWEKTRLPETLLLGFFAYYLCFFIICIPCKLLLASLSLLMYLWLVVLTAVLVIFTIKLRKNALLYIDESLKELKSAPLIYGLIAFTVLIQLFVAGLNNNVLAKWDQAYYTGDVASSLYTDTISQYNTYTGEKLEFLEPEYIFETYQNLSAVTCKFFNLHPLMESCTTMLSIVVILYNLIMYLIASSLFSSKEKSLLFIFILMIMNWFSYNDAQPSSMLFLRAYEGKGILVLLILPALLYFFIRIVKNADGNCSSIYGKNFLIILAAFGLNMSSIYMIPFMCASLYGPYLLIKRDGFTLKRICLMILPIFIMLILYLLFSKFIFIYT